MKMRTLVLATSAVMLTSSLAFGHPVETASFDGLAAGFAHPWLGIDHLLVMFLVGLLAAQMKGRSIWVMPLSFLVMTIAGCVLGLNGFEAPLIRVAVVASVIALAIGRNHRLLVASAVIGAIGLLHGHAHGTEIPVMAAPSLFVLGLVSGTITIQMAGIAAGMYLKSKLRGDRRAVYGHKLGAR